MITEEKLDLWIQKNYNVLIIGKHGTGKSTKMIDAAKRNNVKWKYFSAATMDPFCDFIGIPKEKVTEDGTSYLDFVKPKHMTNDIELMIFDEFNRGMKKTTNAVMELIQFKSINGDKFENLRMVWAAINPEKSSDDSDDIEYDVEKLDPAIRDRFHIIVESDDSPDRKFFYDTFGENGTTIIEWWNNLGKTNPEIQSKISPRRLEYALKIYNDGADLNDCLPKGANISQLMEQLAKGSFSKRLQQYFENKDEIAAKKSLSNENFYSGTIVTILKNNDYINFFASLLTSEKFTNLIVSDNHFRKTVLDSDELCNKNIDRLKNIIKADSAGAAIIKQIKNKIKDSISEIDLIINDYLIEPVKNHSDPISTTMDRQAVIEKIEKLTLRNITQDRINDLFTLTSLIAFRTMSEWANTSVILKKLSKINKMTFLTDTKILLDYVLNNKLFLSYADTPEKIEKMKHKWEKVGIKYV